MIKKKEGDKEMIHVSIFSREKWKRIQKQKTKTGKYKYLFN